jgi:hypothetical protein
MIDPHTASYGHTHVYANLCIFGSTCWVHAKDTPISTTHIAYQGIFIGYRSKSNTPLVFVPSQDKIFESGGVQFDERRQESLQPSLSTSELTPNVHSAPQATDHFTSTTGKSLSQLNDDDFVAEATRNIRDFRLGSETLVI